ncbi:NF-kappa-B-repressing factor [Synchiropus splendidus]|uniref:NF-kappa-B-repressing factor n=1 Tax=Synchiropus splendidus TaxID=270530 RepID=UPI00237D4433|nr:NF-kappa-B-repressing factor [Synchiropus splendidus]
MAQWSTSSGMPSYEPSPCSEAKRRRFADGFEDPVRAMPLSKFGTRPRFEPVQFVSGGSHNDEKENNKESRRSESFPIRRWESDHYSSYASSSRRPQCPVSQWPESDRAASYSSNSWGCNRSTQQDRDFSHGNTGGSGYGGRSSNFFARTQQDYETKYETHTSRNFDSYQPQHYNGYGGGSRSGGFVAGRQGLGYGQQERPSSSRTSDSPGRRSPACSAQLVQFPQSTLDEKQRLVSSVASAVSVALRNPVLMTGSESPNYNFMLSRSIQACKTNPEYIYVNLKDIPQYDLPKNRKLPSEGYACELRCQNVYLATAYSGSKNGARDRASEQAVKLFLKPVEVRVVQRRYRQTIYNDMVVCQMHCPTPEFLPLIRSLEDKPAPNSKNQHELDPRKHWTEFIVKDNAYDAICILNNSATFNRMKVDYHFEPVANGNAWQCSVFVQGEMVAQATGTKKSSKHAAAEEAVNKLRMNQAARQQEQRYFGEPSDSGGFGLQSSRKKDLNELVILENSDNAICIINDTAQFNKVNADYSFSVLPDSSWKCDVYLEGQYVASGVGHKKIVKHIAAVEALNTLKRTQAVVKSKVNRDEDPDAISRFQIMARAGVEDTKQEIKEDNIGNQLLRKMGWKGGGLGRDGEGIAEPIKVKEQFSREGLGMDANKSGNQVTKRDIEEIIRNYVSSDRQDDLRFSNDLTNDERKQVHHVCFKYGLRSKSYGQGKNRFLVVSRKVRKDQLIGQLLQEGQVGRYELIKPQASHC